MLRAVEVSTIHSRHQGLKCVRTGVSTLVLMGSATERSEPVRACADRGIKLLQALYHEPTLECLKRMLNAFA